MNHNLQLGQVANAAVGVCAANVADERGAGDTVSLGGFEE